MLDPDFRDQVLRNFEVLGDSCEFGFIQRTFDYDPLGLLRWAGLRFQDLLRGLHEGFSKLENSHDIQPFQEQDSYNIRLPHYNSYYHTFRKVDIVSIDDLIASERRRLLYLRDRLMEDLASSEKIFLFRQNTMLPKDHLLALHDALRIYGNNTLLFITRADGWHEAGEVELVRDRLMIGFVDCMSSRRHIMHFSREAWVDVLTKALDLWKSFPADAMPHRVLVQEIRPHESPSRDVTEGFHPPEPTGCWIKDGCGILKFSGPFGSGRYTLRLRGMPFMCSDWPHQRMVVNVNGVAVRHLTCVPQEGFDVDFGVEMATDRIEITVVTPDGKIPKEYIDGNGDDRCLSYFMRSASLYKAEDSVSPSNAAQGRKDSGLRDFVRSKLSPMMPACLRG